MALVTLWFINTEHPRQVLESEPQADRGFARKYLSQLNPRWPLTHIGDFDMLRSTAPGDSEFYIGAYPGLSVVQTLMSDLTCISDIPERYRSLVGATDIYATAVAAVSTGTFADAERAADPFAAHNVNETFGAFAHWHEGKLKRAFSATREHIFEDTGLPHSFELPFWEGTLESTGIQLPFIPAELAHAAQQHWLKLDNYDPLAVPVAAFATDGRPEPKTHSSYLGSDAPDTSMGTDVQHSSSDYLQEQESVSSAHSGYDDYASPAGVAEPTGQEVARDLAVSALRSTVRGLKSLQRISSTTAKRIGDEVRRRARGSS